MSEVSSGTVDGIHFKIGDRFRLTSLGVEDGVGWEKGESFEVKYIDFQGKNDHNISVFNIGLEGKYTGDDRSNLNGRCGDFKGVETGSHWLFKYFEYVNTNQDSFIKTDLVFKKKNLIGMKCKVISNIVNCSEDVFVEFNENIGGCSSDGLGKNGYCLLVNRGLLCDKIEEVEGRKEEKKRKKKARGKSKKKKKTKKK